MRETNPTPERLAGYGLLLAGTMLVGLCVALVEPLVAAMPVFLPAWLRFGAGDAIAFACAAAGIGLVAWPAPTASRNR